MSNSMELSPMKVMIDNNNEKTGKIIYEKYLKDLDYKYKFFNQLKRNYFDNDHVDKYENQYLYIIIEFFYELINNQHFDIANNIIQKWEENEDNNMNKSYLQKTRIKFLMILESIVKNDNIDIKDETKQDKKLSFFYSVPVINLIYEIFFDQTPGFEEIKAVLELIGIMGALLFSIVVSVLVSVTYDSYVAAIENWNPDGLYGDCWIDGYGQLYFFVDNIMTSVNTSFMSFLLTVFCYLILNTSKLEGEELEKWWFYVKWVVFLTFILLTVSVIGLFNALQNFIQWNVPNEYVLNNGCNTDVGKILGSNKSGNIWAQTIFNYSGWVLGTGIPSLLLLSLAVYMKKK